MGNLFEKVKSIFKVFFHFLNRICLGIFFYNSLRAIIYFALSLYLLKSFFLNKWKNHFQNFECRFHFLQVIFCRKENNVIYLFAKFRHR